MPRMRLTLLALPALLAACATNTPPATETAPLSCRAVDQREVEALFDRWNVALRSGEPREVVSLYAPRSILLPTLSNRPRVTPQEQEDYFRYFLKDRPSGRIDFRRIHLGCNSVVDTGLYTFSFDATGAVAHARYSFSYAWDGARWLIVSHHSSAMPETR